MENLENEFNTLLERIKNKDMEYRPNQQEKLKLYALYKQITEGDVNGDKPSMAHFVERAKYTAWERLKGMSKEDAMKAYIGVFEGHI
ncbi:acyl-CoA-binding protein [Thiotrichales bacterium 19S11-10]|nr:acyl-CoA-binding protein [Thiotrichales bacterium 19S11-10]MCF6807195.1 acyl-CoA-binding protein [Thiotrichales bacterium 19S9-11]MCF6811164.1 acyl-CoA-binding protein [Thiotrichales bacterium 19S9-12]